jgi:hypothetical protein
MGMTGDAESCYGRHSYQSAGGYSAVVPLEDSLCDRLGLAPVFR